MMLQLLLLALLLMVKADRSDIDYSGNGDFHNDDEEDYEQERPELRQHPLGVKNGSEDTDIEDGSTTIIIIAGVSVVALAIVAIIAVLLFRRHLQRREQGVYSVPVEQEKGV